MFENENKNMFVVPQKPQMHNYMQPRMQRTWKSLMWPRASLTLKRREL